MGLITTTFPANTNPAFQKSTTLPAAIATTGSSVPTPWVLVLVAPKAGPEDSILGWGVTQNSTSQTIYFWSNVPGDAPVCNKAAVPLSSPFVSGFSLCAGSKAGSLFQQKSGSYSIGPQGVERWSDARNASSMDFTEGGCVPVIQNAANTPFDTGAYSMSFQKTQVGINPGWLPPSYCFH